MKKIFSLSLFSIISIKSFASYAQDSQQQQKNEQNYCYAVVVQNQQIAPYTPIMINKCTGNTWLLVRSPIGDKNGRPTGSYTYTWQPLQIGTEIPILTPGK